MLHGADIAKNLAPIYEELGKKFSNTESVVIAKMDLTENNLPASAGFSVQGFPTLKLIRAETNEVVDYNGERTLQALTDFILKHASIKPDLGHDEL